MMQNLCNFIQKQFERATIEKINMKNLPQSPDVSIPYFFRTPQNQEIDLRLFSKDLMRKALRQYI